jgi:hypothetical protein
VTATAQASRLRALLLAGDDADRQAARSALTGRVLAALAGRELPVQASREHTVRQAEIGRLALALDQARRQLTGNRAQLLAIVDDLAPGLTSRYGVGPVSAAQAIVSFSHPGPLPQRGCIRCAKRHQPDSGQQWQDHPAPAQPRRRPGPQPRHPRHRGEPDPQLSRTRAYVARSAAEGKTARETRRCLKRYIARELYRQLNRSMNLPAEP